MAKSGILTSKYLIRCDFLQTLLDVCSADVMAILLLGIDTKIIVLRRYELRAFSLLIYFAIIEMPMHLFTRTNMNPVSKSLNFRFDLSF